MSNNPQDRFARIMAVISLVVAIAAIAIPHMQQKAALKLQKEQFEKLQREELSIKLEPIGRGLVRMTNHDLGPWGNVVQIPWELTVSNTGNRQLSIASYQLTRGEWPGATSYSGIDGGLLTFDDQPVDFPVTLEPGEMQRFIIFIGITVPDQVFSVLNRMSESESDELDRKKVSVALAKEGVDLYGNKVDYREFEGGAYILSVEGQNQDDQRFWIMVNTGRDNQFSDSAVE